MKIYESIQHESRVAKTMYGAFNSSHELYSVLLEEVEELRELVRLNTYKMNDNQKEQHKVNMIKELTQIAAVASRGISEIKTNQIKHL